MSLKRKLLYGGGAFPWTPDLIPRSMMFGRLDAERADTITQAAGLVSSWVDTITGTAFVQVTDASKPGYSATGFNGRPCLTFDGTADNLAYTAGAIAWPNSGSFEVWALVDQTLPVSDTAARIPVGWPNATTNGFSLQRVVVSGANRLRVSVGTGAAQVQAEAASFEGRCLIRSIYNGTTVTPYINGSAGATSSSVTASFSGATRYRIGCAAASSVSNFWSGNINFLAITRLLSDATAANLTAYLNARRGV